MLTVVSKGLGICDCCWGEIYGKDDKGNVRCMECGTLKVEATPGESVGSTMSRSYGSNYNPRTAGKTVKKTTKLARIKRIPKSEKEEESEDDHTDFPRDLDCYRGPGVSLTGFPVGIEYTPQQHIKGKTVLDYLRENIQKGFY